MRPFQFSPDLPHHLECSHHQRSLSSPHVAQHSPDLPVAPLPIQTRPCRILSPPLLHIHYTPLPSQRFPSSAARPLCSSAGASYAVPCSRPCPLATFPLQSPPARPLLAFPLPPRHHISKAAVPSPSRLHLPSHLVSIAACPLPSSTVAACPVLYSHRNHDVSTHFTLGPMLPFAPFPITSDHPSSVAAYPVVDSTCPTQTARLLCSPSCPTRSPLPPVLPVPGYSCTIPVLS